MHVSSDDAQGDDFDVEICEADTSRERVSLHLRRRLHGPDGRRRASRPGTLVFRRTTGLALSANTNYVVVITQRGTGSVQLDSTTSGGEDTSTRSLGLEH